MYSKIQIWIFPDARPTTADGWRPVRDLPTGLDRATPAENRPTCPLGLPIHWAYPSTGPTHPLCLPIHWVYPSTGPTHPPSTEPTRLTIWGSLSGTLSKTTIKCIENINMRWQCHVNLLFENLVILSLYHAAWHWSMKFFSGCRPKQTPRFLPKEKHLMVVIYCNIDHDDLYLFSPNWQPFQWHQGNWSSVQTVKFIFIFSHLHFFTIRTSVT